MSADRTFYTPPDNIYFSFYHNDIQYTVIYTVGGCGISQTFFVKGDVTDAFIAFNDYHRAWIEKYNNGNEFNIAEFSNQQIEYDNSVFALSNLIHGNCTVFFDEDTIGDFRTVIENLVIKNNHQAEWFGDIVDCVSLKTRTMFSTL